jgi:Transcription factor Tfb2 (p52) C-terminal domain
MKGSWFAVTVGDLCEAFASVHAGNQVKDDACVQIMLWERELNRLQCSEAALFNNFDTPTMFNKAVEKAQSLGCHLFSDRASTRLVVTKAGEQPMSKFVQSLKKGI